MITLLMAFFVMMYGMSILDLKKFEAAAASLHKSLGGGGGILNSGGPTRSRAPAARFPDPAPRCCTPSHDDRSHDRHDGRPGRHDGQLGCVLPAERPAADRPGGSRPRGSGVASRPSWPPGAWSGLQIVGNSCARLGEVALYAEFAFQGALIANNLVDTAATGIIGHQLQRRRTARVVQGNILRNLFRREQEPEDKRGEGIAVEADASVIGNVIESAPTAGIVIGSGTYLRDIVATDAS